MYQASRPDIYGANTDDDDKEKGDPDGDDPDEDDPEDDVDEDDPDENDLYEDDWAQDDPDEDDTHTGDTNECEALKQYFRTPQEYEFENWSDCRGEHARLWWW